MEQYYLREALALEKPDDGLTVQVSITQNLEDFVVSAA